MIHYCWLKPSLPLPSFPQTLVTHASRPDALTIGVRTRSPRAPLLVVVTLSPPARRSPRCPLAQNPDALCHSPLAHCATAHCATPPQSSPLLLASCHSAIAAGQATVTRWVPLFSVFILHLTLLVFCFHFSIQHSKFLIAFRWMLNADYVFMEMVEDWNLEMWSCLVH